MMSGSMLADFAEGGQSRREGLPHLVSGLDASACPSCGRMTNRHPAGWAEGTSAAGRRTGRVRIRPVRLRMTKAAFFRP